MVRRWPPRTHRRPRAPSLQQVGVVASHPTMAQCPVAVRYCHARRAAPTRRGRLYEVHSANRKLSVRDRSRGSPPTSLASRYASTEMGHRSWAKIVANGGWLGGAARPARAGGRPRGGDRRLRTGAPRVDLDSIAAGNGYCATTSRRASRFNALAGEHVHKGHDQPGPDRERRAVADPPVAGTGLCPRCSRRGPKLSDALLATATW